MATLTLEVSGTFPPTTCADIANVISLLESAVGRSRFELLDYRTISPPGQALAPANRIAARESKKATQTIAIYGRYGSRSSASAALQSSLANKLRARLDSDGLTVFPMTWKAKNTPSGRPYCEHVLQRRLMSAQGSTSPPKLWATPTVEDRRRGVAPSRPHDKGIPLTQEVGNLKLWPTPRASANENRTQGLPPSHGNGHGIALAGLVTATAQLWPTVTARDWRSAKCNPETRQANPERGAPPLNETAFLATGGRARTESSGYLHPAFPCWLMGYPQTWLEHSPDSATLSSRKSRRNS